MVREIRSLKETEGERERLGEGECFSFQMVLWLVARGLIMKMSSFQ